MTKNKQTKLSPAGTITGLAFAPSGSLFLTEEDAHKHHSVMELTPSGQLRHFAGAKPDCGCADGGEDCTCPADDKVGVSEGDRVRESQKSVMIVVCDYTELGFVFPSFIFSFRVS